VRAALGRGWRRFARPTPLLVAALVLIPALVWLAVVRVGDHHHSAALSAELHRDRLPLLVLLVLVAITAAGLLSFSSSLGFWTGWLGELRDPRTLFGPSAAPAVGSSDPAAAYVVYLDGIHVRAESHPPRISLFLERLMGKLGNRVMLITNVDPYVVMADGLPSARISGALWRRLFYFSEDHNNLLVRGFCTLLVQAYNILRVAISSDWRYGIIYNYEIALAIALQLEAAGFRPGQPAAIILLGYSGGGQIALGASDYLARICGQPVQIISLAGVFSGNPSLEGVEHWLCLQGGSDPLGGVLSALLFPGRSCLRPHSSWNRACLSGRVERRRIRSMGHCGHNGPFGVFSESLASSVARRILTWTAVS